MILHLLLFIVVFWIILIRFKRRRFYELVSKIPTPAKDIPILGSTHRFIGNTEHIMLTLQKISYDSMETGGIAGSFLGHLYYVFLTDPEDTEKVLKSCLDKDDLVSRLIQNVIGYGVLFAPVPVWRVRRKILKPALAPKIVDNFMHIFANQTTRLAEKLEASCNGELFSVWPYLNRYALDAVCETALSIKIGAQDDPNVPFLTSLNRVTNLISERIFHVWYQPDWLYRLFRGKFKEHEKCCQTMAEFIDEVIARKRKELTELQKPELQDDNSNVYENYKNQSFLDLLIKSSGGEKGYNHIELREEIMTIIIAGSDTSAVAIANTFVLLGMYPEIQEKVYHELLSVFGNTDRLMVKEDLPRLQYLECVIKESMRLFPPVPFLVRKVASETTLPSGRILPAGAGVVISVWGAHRDPKYWGPDAECFKPERFHPDNLKIPHPCCYMPFSNGPRNCVGYQYSLMSIKAAVSAVVRRYRVFRAVQKGPIPELKMKFDLMMKAADGYQIALERRQ